MLITFYHRVDIRQQVTETQLRGIVSLGAINLKFNFLTSSINLPLAGNNVIKTLLDNGTLRENYGKKTAEEQFDAIYLTPVTMLLVGDRLSVTKYRLYKVTPSETYDSKATEKSY